MKLFRKTRRTYLIYSLIIFIVSSAIIYFTLTRIITKEQDERLNFYKELIAQKIKYEYPLPIFSVDDYISKTPIRDTLYFKDTMFITIVNGIEKREMYRELTSIETLHGKTYEITTRDSLVKNQELILIVTLSVGIVIFLLIITVYFINTIIMQNIWLPFYENLEILKNFSVENNRPIDLRKTQIDEFQELNQSLTKLTDKINSDFNNLKEFTENASHEMQTPLAIMQTKSEMLMQSDNLDKDQIQRIKSIYLATQRLSKLNKTLLLLSKIENQQFKEKETLFINSIINKHLEIFEDFIITKKIILNKNLSLNSKIDANPLLFDMVISNLISNAIKHNIVNGNIDILTTNLFISFSNAGKPLQLSSSSLFERFKKESSASNSFGLGLAIVKKVCDTYNWEINHSYIENQHNITIYF
ncbi:MAG: HAMP domain-containing histidine kinase [Flavobacteriaceae bacterium]|nr:HAMP domain-containing histidine kinase [Flavobacteriaceae bacterium]